MMRQSIIVLFVHFLVLPAWGHSLVDFTFGNGFVTSIIIIGLAFQNNSLAYLSGQKPISNFKAIWHNIFGYTMPYVKTAVKVHIS